jgi:uncharacterized protein involved in exopolysaccharide biosynthesis
MAQQESSSFNFSSVSVFGFLFKWRWHIAVFVGLAFVTAAIFSSPFFIKPKFKSTVIFYPSTVNSVSKALLAKNLYDGKDPLAFGEEAEAEQLIQILYSDNIREKIIAKFNLMEHYDIDSSDQLRYFKLYKNYTENITFRRTEFMSVEIKVLDTDPKMAADIANEIADLLDETKNEIQKKNAVKGFQVVEAQYLAKSNLVQSISDSLGKLRDLGIFDYALQSDNLNKQYVEALTDYVNESAKLLVYKQNNLPDTDTLIYKTKARIEGSAKVKKVLEEKLVVLSKFGGASDAMTQQLTRELEELSELKMKYDQAKVDVNETLPSKFIVNSAKPAEKKTYPVRWLIVAISMIGAFLFAIVLLVIIENYQRIKASSSTI